MLHVLITLKKRNSWIRATTTITDVRVKAAKLKWQYAQKTRTRETTNEMIE